MVTIKLSANPNKNNVIKIVEITPQNAFDKIEAVLMEKYLVDNDLEKPSKEQFLNYVHETAGSITVHLMAFDKHLCKSRGHYARYAVPVSEISMVTCKNCLKQSKEKLELGDAGSAAADEAT